MSEQTGTALAAVVTSGLPVLDRGSHRRPEDGACLMEYTALLAGQPFSDHPGCTHPVLAALARRVNDTVSDRARMGLARRAPALAGIGPQQAGVAAAVAAAAEATARDDGHSRGGPDPRPPQSQAERRRARPAAALALRDRPGRGWWGRQRDLSAAGRCVDAALARMPSPSTGRVARDRALVEFLDRALTLAAATDASATPAVTLGDPPQAGAVHPCAAGRASGARPAT